MNTHDLNLFLKFAAIFIFTFISCENEFVAKSTTSIKGNPAPKAPPLISWETTDFVTTDTGSGNLVLIAPPALIGYINNAGKKIKFVSKFEGSENDPGIETISHNFNDDLDLRALTAENGSFVSISLSNISEMQEEKGEGTIKLLPKLFVGTDKALGENQRVSFTVRETDNAEYAKIYCESGDALELIDLAAPGSNTTILAGIEAAISAGDIPAQTPAPTNGNQGIWCEAIALHTVRPIIKAVFDYSGSEYDPWIGQNNASSISDLSWTPPSEFVTPDIYNDIPGYDGIYIVGCEITGRDGSKSIVNFMVKFAFHDPPP
ncbi:MAG: hypothetical protein Ta2F_14160 [Termitinemataceae bacterium]|nr:MAG: hypothetical protein Ta2F_14160 [Termitinemataceae bacterium]